MNRKTQVRFTIIELMITIVVGAIMMVVAVPSFTTMLRNNCLTTSANILVADLNIARSEAIKSGFNVFITATNGADAANEYGPGWTIWVDRAVFGTMQATERVRVTQPLPATMTLDNAANLVQVQYLSTGMLPTAAGAVTFNLCDDRTAETGRAITIAPVGRVSINNQFVCP